MNRGVLYATLAYGFWGLYPIYLKALPGIAATEVLAHRMLWSLPFVLLILALRHNWRWLRALARAPRMLGWFAASAATVSINWGIYILAVSTERIMDASLGYFIGPLVNVLIGSLFLRERLRAAQWLAVGLAAAGVAWLTWHAGRVPWIGLTLAVSFATYALLRRRASLGSLEGLAVETALLFPFASGFLAWLSTHDSNTFFQAPTHIQWLLVAAGPITAIPLLLFAAGARQIRFTTLGVLQYIAPSLQFLLAVWIYHEPFEPAKAVGYIAVWCALAIFTGEGLWRTWRARAAAARLAPEAGEKSAGVRASASAADARESVKSAASSPALGAGSGPVPEGQSAAEPQNRGAR